MAEEKIVGYGVGTTEFLWEVHKYTNDYIKFADTKAAFVAGVSTALIGSLVTSSILDSCFKTTPCHWSKMQWAGIVAIIFLSLSLVLSVAAIRPRLWNKASAGFIFWNAVAGHGSATNFTRAFHKLSSYEISDAVSNHLFVLATIAKRKYMYVNYAIASGVIGGSIAGTLIFVQHAWR